MFVLCPRKSQVYDSKAENSCGQNRGRPPFCPRCAQALVSSSIKEYEPFGARRECVGIFISSISLAEKSPKILQWSCSRQRKSIDINDLSVSASSGNRPALPFIHRFRPRSQNASICIINELRSRLSGKNYLRAKPKAG